MRAVRIILAVLFCVVISRGAGLLGTGQNGIIYPTAAIALGVIGLLVLFTWRRR